MNITLRIWFRLACGTGAADIARAYEARRPRRYTLSHPSFVLFTEERPMQAEL